MLKAKGISSYGERCSKKEYYFKNRIRWARSLTLFWPRSVSWRLTEPSDLSADNVFVPCTEPDYLVSWEILSPLPFFMPIVNEVLKSLSLLKLLLSLSCLFLGLVVDLLSLREVSIFWTVKSLADYVSILRSHEFSTEIQSAALFLFCFGLL